jgi:hypothetical protein
METWLIADLVQNAKGGTRSANILGEGGVPPIKRLATTSNPLCSPFGASSFDASSTRMSMDFAIPKDLRPWLEKLDAWAFEKLLKESPRLFKKQVTTDELKMMWQPVIKKHQAPNGQEYGDTFKTKYSQGKLRVWDWDHMPREPPASYKGCDLVGIVAVKNFWFSGNSVGLVLELQAVMCREQTSECPFLD